MSSNIKSTTQTKTDKSDDECYEWYNPSTFRDSRVLPVQKVTLNDVKKSIHETDAETAILRMNDRVVVDAAKVYDDHDFSDQTSLYSTFSNYSSLIANSNETSQTKMEGGDETLFSISMQLRQTYAVASVNRTILESSTVKDEESKDSDNGDMKEDTGDDEDNDDQPQNSGEHLWKNANMLFRNSNISNQKRRKGNNLSKKKNNNHIDNDSLDDEDRKRKTIIEMAKNINLKTKKEVEFMYRFLMTKKKNFWQHVGYRLFHPILPVLAISIILYYSHNPKVAFLKDGSLSWWIIFIFIRQVILLDLAKVIQFIIIDGLFLRSHFIYLLFRPMIVLSVVNSKGFPFLCVMFSLLNLIFCVGDSPFNKHWLFFQNRLSVFNDDNPAGNITASSFFGNTIKCILIVGIILCLKKVMLGFFFGRNSYLKYQTEVTKIMSDMLLISLVANLVKNGDNNNNNSGKTIYDCEIKEGDDLTEDSKSLTEISESNKFGKSTLTFAQRTAINKLLGRWEEPILHKKKKKVFINDILQFRQAVEFMKDNYPFSFEYGKADSRESCISSAQNIYKRLLLASDKERLHFETIAPVAFDEKGNLDNNKFTQLVKLFRPDRESELSILDFVKSCDQVYKNLRFLAASIENTAQIDGALEKLLNTTGGVILIFFLLSIYNVDVDSLLSNLAVVVAALAFMISDAASNFIQGIAFILVRRPFDIGDRVSVTNVEDTPSMYGASTWFVETVGLYSTTFRYAATNEVASYSNGSLASSRIINAKRSPNAIVDIYLKFDVEEPEKNIEVFRGLILNFVKVRPREWQNFNAFRLTEVDTDGGYVEYVLSLQHTESWQNLGLILASKANVTQYCNKILMKMKMVSISLLQLGQANEDVIIHKGTQ